MSHPLALQILSHTMAGAHQHFLHRVKEALVVVEEPFPRLFEHLLGGDAFRLCFLPALRAEFSVELVGAVFTSCHGLICDLRFAIDWSDFVGNIQVSRFPNLPYISVS